MEGKAEMVEVKMNQNVAAVYFKMIIKDENGKLWEIERNAFKFDFEEVKK